MTRVGAVASAVAAALAAVLLTATPAAADPPRPTDYRSEVVAVEPPLPEGIELTVVGGDAFLELTVPEGGPTVVVPDYGEEATADAVPYLRFSPDGTVERNDRATATAANESRYGTSDATPDPEAEPAWTVVSRDGTYAWHDHRIHWMSPRPPSVVAADGTVDLGGPEGRWEVPLLVDDAPVVATGRLVLLDSPSPWPWALGVVAIAAGGVALSRRAPRAVLAMAVGAGALATVAGLARWSDAPAGSGASPIPAVVAGVATIGALVALVGPARWRLVATALAAAGLVGWALTRLDVLARAVLPTSLPDPADRAATAVALGVGIALAVGLVVRSSRPA